MKTKIVSIIISCLILFNCIPAYASTNVIMGDGMAEEIKPTQDGIVSMANNFQHHYNYEIITAEDIDYSKAVRLYVGTNMFREDISKKDDIVEFLENNGYFYQVPIFRDENTVMVNVDKVEELTLKQRLEIPKEVVKSLEQKAGQWVVSSCGVIEKTVDYKEHVTKVLESNNIENAQVYFIGGASTNLTMLAMICFDDTQDVQFLVLDKYAVTKMEVNGITYLDDDVLFSYEEVKAIADKDYEELKDNYSFFGIVGLSQTEIGRIIIISAVLVVVIVITVPIVIIVKKKKKKKSDITQ